MYSEAQTLLNMAARCDSLQAALDAERAKAERWHWEYDKAVVRMHAAEELTVKMQADLVEARNNQARWCSRVVSLNHELELLRKEHGDTPPV